MMMQFQIQLQILIVLLSLVGLINSYSLLSSSMEVLSAKNAELLAIKEQNKLVGIKTGGVKPLSRASISLVKEKSKAFGKLMEKQGCSSIKQVLSSETSLELKQWINDECERSKEEVNNDVVEFSERFGGVNCRGLDGKFGQRQDLYLPLTNLMVKKAAAEAMTNLKPLLDEIVGGDTALVHEISSLVSNPGSPRQCLHCDTIQLPCPQYPNAMMKPLYTFFIALQDVEDDMGHTVFLPSTHTEEAHLMWNTEQSRKEMFISVNPAVESKLKTGDTAIFDSR